MNKFYDIKNLRGDIIGELVAGIVALAFGVQSGSGALSELFGVITAGILAALFGGTVTQGSGPTGPMTVLSSALIAAAINHTSSLEAIKNEIGPSDSFDINHIAEVNMILPIEDIKQKSPVLLELFEKKEIGIGRDV